MRIVCLSLLAFTCSTALFAQNKPGAYNGTYPETRKIDQTDVFFGTSVADPYRWLEDDQSADTKSWVAAENKVTNAYLEQIPFRQQLRDRITTLWNYEKYTAPFKEGSYTYYYKNNGLQNQSVLYRQDAKGKTEVFLDPNTFSADGTTSLAGLNFSKDGSLAALQLSEGGSDWRKVVVIRTNNLQRVDDTLVDIKFSGISWKGDEGFYYSSYDKPKEGSQLSGKTQYHKLYYHKLGTKQSSDVLVFGGEKTPRRYIQSEVTEDQHYLVITAAIATYGAELYVMDLTSKNPTIQPIATGYDFEYDVIYAEAGKLFVLTNKGAANRKLVSIDPARPAEWKTVIAEGKFPLSVSTGGRKLFAQYIKDAVSEVQQYSLEGKLERTITLPGLGTARGFSGKKDQQDIYYSYTSYTYPTTIFKYNVSKGTSTVYKKPAVQFNPEDFESRQVFYTSSDGTKVPMIITYKKGVVMNGKNPTLLYGYGGFNVNVTPSFSVSNVAFLERGGIYAVPNLRGGGEYGDAWHKAGTKMQKQNVFNDFIAAAEYLIKENYTSPDFLAISGASNGGLLVGATMTQRPELFRVAFPAVGVMDMLRYHRFTAGAGWAYDYGTADDNAEMFQYLLHYSPVHNVKSGTCYPATLVTTADHDDRVVPAHSFKFAAELQAKQACNNPVLIHIQVKAGHGSGKPTAKIIEEEADKWAFMFYNMGLSL